MNVCILENGVWQSLVAVYNNLQFIEVTMYLSFIVAGVTMLINNLTCLPNQVYPSHWLENWLTTCYLRLLFRETLLLSCFCSQLMEYGTWIFQASSSFSCNGTK